MASERIHDRALPPKATMVWKDTVCIRCFREGITYWKNMAFACDQIEFLHESETEGLKKSTYHFTVPHEDSGDT